MKIVISFAFLFLTQFSLAKEIVVSENLILHQTSEHTYVHTHKNNNGLVFISDGEAIIVSTPDSDLETQNLINWVKDEKKAKIVGYVIDRWHPDAMEGLDVVQRNGIKNYAHELTREIARNKGLPIPDIGFHQKKEFMVGNKSVICHFLGEAHTSDGIVIWVPSEQVLFGGNGIRNLDGWAGNIGDANLGEWSETAKRIKTEYGAADVVVPGHGMHGGVELIDYTISLYGNIVNEEKYSLKIPYSDPNKEFYIKAESEIIEGNRHVLKNAQLIAQDETKFIEIVSLHIKYWPHESKIVSEEGIVRIYDKTKTQPVLRTSVKYNGLYVVKVDQAVGFAVVLKGIVR